MVSLLGRAVLGLLAFQDLGQGVEYLSGRRLSKVEMVSSYWWLCNSGHELCMHAPLVQPILQERNSRR